MLRSRVRKPDILAGPPNLDSMNPFANMGGPSASQRVEEAKSGQYNSSAAYDRIIGRRGES